MRVFVTGVNGQLGHDVMNELARRGIDAVGSGIEPEYIGIMDGSPVCTMPYVGLDLTNEEEARKILTEEKIDCLIHCAAWTAVDDAEDPAKKDLVFRINGEASGNLARVMKDLKGKMLYLSTDYVFSGEGTKPWEEEERDFHPINVYGASKLAGEEEIRKALPEHFIVRIAWVFGLNGKNFIKTMLQVGKKHPSVRVVSDQVGSPTYTLDLARLLVDMILTDKYGRYHATNEGLCSWYEFACEIFKQANLDVAVTPVNSDAFPVKAKRPHNSRMDKSKLTKNGFELLPSWQDALKRYLSELENS